MLTRLTLAVAVLAAGTAARADTPAVVSIRSPGPGEILYGPTRVVAEASDEARDRVAQVLFYLEPLPAPICSDTEAPFTCDFDAGTDFQGRTILVRALDRRGRFVGADSVETLAFPEAERVVERIIRVPVVAAKHDGGLLDLAGEDLTCLYAGKACEVLGFDPVVEPVIEQTAVPLSILVLVDVSPSVSADRDEILKALNAIVDHFPEQAEVALAEFARHYQRLGPFTVDRAELQRQMLRLSFDVHYTCLFRALDHALTSLGARGGHRALFVVSDGEETCDARAVGSGPAARFLGLPGMVAHVVELARSVAAPIYVYRLNEDRAMPSTADPGYEGLARETGGRLFATGNLHGIGPSFDDLIQDLETTWMVDISLPAAIAEGRPRRLVLEIPGSEAPRLRYPEYWSPDNMERSNIALLDSEIAQTRYWAAKSLRTSRNPDVLRKLVATARRETDEDARLEELDAILGITATFLLHGDAKDQKAALSAIESLGKVEPDALLPLQPALVVYQKVEASDRLKRKAAGFLANAE
jgi:hypothetical protein